MPHCASQLAMDFASAVATMPRHQPRFLPGILAMTQKPGLWLSADFLATQQRPSQDKQSESLTVGRARRSQQSIVEIRDFALL